MRQIATRLATAAGWIAVPVAAVVCAWSAVPPLTIIAAALSCRPS